MRTDSKQPTAQNYRAAVIACGRMSRAHGRAYLDNPQIELIACADISDQALESFGTEFGIPPKSRYLDYVEMIDQQKPDLVSICSLHDLHAPMTIAVAAHLPKAILCEKPIALSLGEADAMIEACSRADTRLIVGHQRRFSPQYVAARKALQSGAIGVLESIETHGHPSCSLLVDGTHTVDLVRWFADDQPIEWVFGQIDASARRSAWGSSVENAAMLLFRFTGGIRAFMTLGHRFAPGQKPSQDALWPDVPGGVYHQIILRGSDGQIEIDGDAPVEGRPWVRLVRNGSIGEIPLPSPETDERGRRKGAHALLTDDLLTSIETGVPHLLDASSARATLEVLMAAYESSRRRGVVGLPLDIPENPLFAMLESGEA